MGTYVRVITAMERAEAIGIILNLQGRIYQCEDADRRALEIAVNDMCTCEEMEHEKKLLQKDNLTAE